MKSYITLNDVLKTYESKHHGKKALNKYKKWFPLRYSVGLSSLVADLICDGHLQGYPKFRFDYTSKNKKELKRFEKNLYHLFEIKGKIRKCTTNKLGQSFNYGVNCKPLAKALIILGVPFGEKVITLFRVPKWILNNKNYFREFVKRAFICEGMFDLDDFWIGIEFWKAVSFKKSGFDFLNDIKYGLEKHFNIKTSSVFTYNSKCIRKDKIKTIPIKFTIHGRKQVEKFEKEINLNIKK